jgi:hypothetical protein
MEPETRYHLALIPGLTESLDQENIVLSLVYGVQLVSFVTPQR